MKNSRMTGKRRRMGMITAMMTAICMMAIQGITTNNYADLVAKDVTTARVDERVSYSETALNPGNIVYVDENRYGDGSSWNNAYPDLADVLIAAAQQRAAKTPDNELIKAIYVAKGIYYPLHNAADVPTNDSHDAAFVLVEDVKIFGGFVNDGSLTMDSIPLFGEPGRNGVTTLSGDINHNSTGNVYHVVIGANIPDNGETVLDGVTVTGGKANGTFSSIRVNKEVFYRNSGGGLCLVNASPKLVNVTFYGNSAENFGGGMYNMNNSSPVLNHVTVSGNSADYGGGMFNENHSSPVLTNVIVTENSASNGGGGIYNDYSLPVLTNLIVVGNKADYGGGMFNYFSLPVLTNVTVSGNSAVFGGGMYNNNSSTRINNSIFWGNTASANGKNIYNWNKSIPAFTHSIIEGSGGSGKWNTAAFGADNGNNLDADPMFVAPFYSQFSVYFAGETDTLIDFLTSSNELNYQLQKGSPAIDAGDNTLYLTISGISDFTGEKDLAGNPRLSGFNIDMGAYEYLKGETDNDEFVIRNDFLRAYALNGVLYVSGLTPGKTVRIYNILGTPVFKGIATGETDSYPSLPKNCIYIITNNGQTVKVMN